MGGKEENVKIIRRQVLILSPLWKEKGPLVNAERELLAAGTLLFFCSCLLPSFHPLLAQTCPFLHPSLSHTPTRAHTHTPIALLKSPQILFPPFLETSGFMGCDQPQNTAYPELNQGWGSRAAAWSTETHNRKEMGHHRNNSDTCPHMTP